MDEKEKKQHMKTKVSKELNQHINELVNNKKISYRRLFVIELNGLFFIEIVNGDVICFLLIVD
jgi:hypothetical protein